jgi:hypothetical protein
MNVSLCGFKVNEFALEFRNEPDYQLTTCSTCTVVGKCGRKMGSTLGPNCGPRARVLLIHLTHHIVVLFIPQINFLFEILCMRKEIDVFGEFHLISPNFIHIF